MGQIWPFLSQTDPKDLMYLIHKYVHKHMCPIHKYVHKHTSFKNCVDYSLLSFHIEKIFKSKRAEEPQILIFLWKISAKISSWKVHTFITYLFCISCSLSHRFSLLKILNAILVLWNTLALVFSLDGSFNPFLVVLQFYFSKEVTAYPESCCSFNLLLNLLFSLW